ncbi:MAG: hypothetical protein ACRDPW_04470, partial [Mycobacteriales bacterium]
GCPRRGSLAPAAADSPQTRHLTGLSVRYKTTTWAISWVGACAIHRSGVVVAAGAVAALR